MAACATPTPSDSFRQLQTVLTAELRAYCKILVAEQEAAISHFKASVDDRLKAESEQREHFAKQLQDFGQKQQCLAGGLSNMDLRLTKTASQQVSAHAEHQTFENQITAVFQSLEEALQEVRKMLQAGIPQFDAPAELTCRNLVVHGPKDNGGQLHPPSESSSAPPFATGTIDFLEAALASMQQHEHEQIHRLRGRIRDLQDHRGVALGGCTGAVFCA